MQIRAATAIITCALLAPGTRAQAQGVSTDVEFVRPSFGAGSFTGVDVARLDGPLTFRSGLVMQYERVPVLLYNPDGFVIAVPVKNRAHFNLGASLDINDLTTINLVVPMASDWGGDPIGGVAGNGFGLGDISVGLRLSPIQIESGGNAVRGGARAGVMMPTGRKQVFLGDKGIRGTIGLLASVEIGPVELATDLGLLGRTREETGRDLTTGSELVWGNALRVNLPEVTRTSINVQALTKSGFANFLNKGAENAVEGLFGVQVKATDFLSWDVGAGQGFTQGMGTTDYRFLTAITVRRTPNPEEKPEPIVREEPPPLPPPPPIETLVDEPEPEEEWDEGELARITADLDRIVIRDMLQFEVGRTILLEESRPTLEAVGAILNDNASVGHLVIEGHASEDGDYDANYELSLGRAEVVFRELLQVGVHPDRVSFRAMGEVEPLAMVDESLSDQENERQLARNRRVEFQIVHNYSDVLAIPDRRIKGHREPWSGQPYEVLRPKRPEIEVPPVDDSNHDFSEEAEDFEFDVDEPPKTTYGDDEEDDEIEFEEE